MAESFGLHINIVTVQEYDEVFEFVKRGEADVAVANHFYGTLHARQFGLEDTAIVFNPSALYFASRRGNEELLNAIDNILPGLKKDTHSIFKVLSLESERLNLNCQPDRTLASSSALPLSDIIGVSAEASGEHAHRNAGGKTSDEERI